MLEAGSCSQLMDIQARVCFTTHLSAQKALCQLSAMLDLVVVYVNSVDLDPGGVERFDIYNPHVHTGTLGCPRYWIDHPFA